MTATTTNAAAQRAVLGGPRGGWLTFVSDERLWRGYGTLTYALDPGTAAAEYLRATFPHRAALAGPYKANAPGLRVPPSAGVWAGTMGTAFDVLAKVRLTGLLPGSVVSGALNLGVYEDVGCLYVSSVDDPGLRFASAWVGALAAEAYRSPFVENGLTRLDDQGLAQGFQTIVSPGVVEELAALEELAEAELFPRLGEPVVAEAAFATADRVAADADLICGGTLVEIKTTLGSGAGDHRYAALDISTLYQIVAYVLCDSEDALGIDAVGLYSARYGYYVRWPLGEFLSQLAGRRVNLAAERTTWAEVLSSGSWNGVEGRISRSRANALDKAVRLYFEAHPEEAERLGYTPDAAG